MAERAAPTDAAIGHQPIEGVLSGLIREADTEVVQQRNEGAAARYRAGAAVCTGTTRVGAIACASRRRSLTEA